MGSLREIFRHERERRWQGTWLDIMASPLYYNILWIERIFRSHAVTEALLAPERESGNITTHDYELAMRFLPGHHRHYRVLTHLSTLPVPSHLRK